MPTKAADLVDQNVSQRDNIACKGKMEMYRDALLDEKDKLDTAESLITNYDDENLQKTIDDVRLVLDVANYICTTLAEGIRMLPQALQETVEVIRARIKVVPPHVKIDKNAVIVRLWKAANVMEQLSAYADETEKLAKKTAALANEAAAKAEMTASDLAAAMKELHKAQADTEAREKKEKEESDKSEKEELADEGKKVSKKIRKMAEEVSNTIADAKKVVLAAEKLAKQSSGSNPDVPTKLEEAQEAIGKATEALVETKKSADAAETSSSKMADLSGKKNVPVEAVQKFEEEIQQSLDKATETSDEAKSQAKTAKKCGSKVIEIVEEEKARDKAWKTAKEAKTVAKAVRKDADTAVISANESEGLADDVQKDIEEAISIEESLRSLIEELKQVSDDVMKSADKAELQSEEIERLKTEGGEPEDIARVTAETKDVIKEAKDAAETAKKLSAKATEIGARAKILIEKQSIVATSKSYAAEAQRLVAELRQFREETAAAISTAREMVSEEHDAKSKKDVGQKKQWGALAQKTTTEVEQTEETDLDYDAVLKEAETGHEEAAGILEDAEKSSEKTADAALDVEERYKSNHSVDDINKVASKAGKYIEETRVKVMKAQDNEENAKSSATQVINHIDEGRTTILANSTLLKAKDCVQQLYKDLKEANFISSQAVEIAKKVTSDMDEGETMAEGIKEAGIKAKGNADTLQKLVTNIEGRTTMLETYMAERDDLQKIKDSIKSLEEGMGEISKTAEEARETNKEYRKTTDEIGERVSTYEKFEASKSTTPLIDDAKRVAREARDMVQVVKQSAKDTQQAADDCGRDTDEARRAIQAAEEAAQDTKKAGNEVIRSAENIDRAIDDLTSIIKNDKSTADEVMKYEEKLQSRVGNTEKAMEKAKMAMARSVQTVEDMEAKNPKHWTFKKYLSPDSDVLSVVRAPAEVLEGLNIVCKENESLTKTVVGEHEELLSNVVSLDPQDVTLKRPILVAIRYTPTIRILGYEVVVKARDQSGDWKVIATNSTERTFDELRGLTFAEVKVDNLSTFVVVRRIVRDRHSIGRRGGTVTSSIEPRVTITYPKETFPISTDVTVQVIPTDTHQLQARRSKWESLKYVMAASPLLHFTHARNIKPKKPLVVTLPVNQLVSQEDEEKKDDEKSSAGSHDIMHMDALSYGSGGGAGKGQQRQGQFQRKKKKVPTATLR